MLIETATYGEDQHFLKLDYGDGSTAYENIKLSIAYFKWVTCIAWGLYLSRAVKNLGIKRGVLMGSNKSKVLFFILGNK